MLQQQRNQSLDALRGFAILTMILSGSIAFGDVMPAWMYHAQVPPPDHKFIPTRAGITWVDLVFPFFLFSMGAAIPLAMQKKIVAKCNFISIFFIAGRRYLLLTFFALFTHHLMANEIATVPTVQTYLLSIAAFMLVFFQLYDNKNEKFKRLFLFLKVMAYALAIALLCFLPFNNGKGFSLTNSDIIIIVLGNMAFFGTIIWWFTKNNPLLRIGILPFIMAVFLAAKESNVGWAKQLYDFNEFAGFNISWVYQFYFLKYLFIIIPGTFAGEYLLQFANQRNFKNSNNDKTHLKIIGLLAFALIITNTIFLFGRHLLLNLSLTVTFLTAIYFLIREAGKEDHLLVYHFFKAGAYLLLLGLFFEAYDGGIKKDHSTYSYYFVCSGLAFFMLIGFTGLALGKAGAAINNYLSLNGRNPMVAYIAGGLLLTPFLHLTGAIVVLEKLNASAWMGFLKGILFTGIVSLITIFFTKKRWFWKT
jgi:predicted acyltransferase